MSRAGLPNGGSPIGPMFVVYERADGQQGYDLELAKASVGPGWHGLLECLFAKLEQYNRHREAPAYVIQVKEKWGRLTVYDMGGDEELFGYLQAIGHASGLICEDCGNRGRTRTDQGWWRTLCDPCAAAQP